jgi:hypothetical protein
MLTLDLEIQNDMYFSVDRSQWRYDESCTKDNVTFYLPRPFHFLSYQSNRLLRRSDLHRKKL